MNLEDLNSTVLEARIAITKSAIEAEKNKLNKLEKELHCLRLEQARRKI